MNIEHHLLSRKQIAAREEQIANMHISMNNAAAAASDREAVITEDRDQVLRRVATLEATLQRCKHKSMISLDEILTNMLAVWRQSTGLTEVGLPIYNKRW